MTVRILLFAGLRERLRSDWVELELPEGATVAELLSALGDAHPPLRELLPPCRVAVEQEFVAAGHRVRAGDEVAVIPPVSGGHGPVEPGPVEPAADDHFYLGAEPLVLDRVIAAVERRQAGGVVTFIGKVRDHSRGHAIDHLEYEAYAPMALKVMRQIAAAVEAEVAGASVAVHHRLGRLAIGEAAVVIAAAAPHRAEAFAACREVIERLKRDVPIWKREVAVDGTTWVVQGP
ncbi:MAG: molybdenum cofactor biosynthesis protein MoaE [Nannocystis sp.]|nr:molybdenum cofactor biosynthesis protein MoaE [Nannocystis sp.]MBA3548208.1 molybdenum cofactor biosynthesis protein MoaE [Nannocystis sp.]